MREQRWINCIYRRALLCLSGLLLLVAVPAVVAQGEAIAAPPPTALAGGSIVPEAITPGAVAIAPVVGVQLPVPRSLDPTATAVAAPTGSVTDSMGYGYTKLTGEVAMAADTVWLYCPVTKNGPLLVVDEKFRAMAMDDLKATENADGTWATADVKSLAPQYAKTFIDDGLTPVSGVAIKEDDVSLVTRVWGGCYRKKRYHLCQGCYHCPQGCYKIRDQLCGSECSVKFSGTKNFKLCRYTGKPWDYCIQKSLAVCSAAGYDCNNCQGNAVCSKVTWYSWSCWTNGC